MGGDTREGSIDYNSDANSDVSSVSAGRQHEREKFDLSQASEIKPWLFLGGQEIAKQKDYLKGKGITHILNCASHVCENYNEGEFTYVRPIDLSDSCTEEIGNFLFQAIAEIEEVRLNQGKIFVHCQKGISRSATLVIAYLMWFDDVDEIAAFQMAKKIRNIVNPNFGFFAELKRFRKRLDWRPTQPTLHRVGPHSAAVSTLVLKQVVRADNKQIFVTPSVEHLDPKGTFLLHSPECRTVFLWVGPDVGLKAEEDQAQADQVRNKMVQSKCPVFRESYEEAGRRLGKMMCKYDRAFSEQGNPCIFVQVETKTNASSAFNSFSGKFWKCLGEPNDTPVGIETIRAHQRDERWTESQTLFTFKDGPLPNIRPTKI